MMTPSIVKKSVFLFLYLSICFLLFLSVSLSLSLSLYLSLSRKMGNGEEAFRIYMVLEAPNNVVSR